jgi:hypothetical protein
MSKTDGYNSPKGKANNAEQRQKSGAPVSPVASVTTPPAANPTKQKGKK